jgi:multidrug resistance efflux pump
MDILLLAIYSFFVWLIFIKFKWLPWNIYSQVTVVVIPVVALTVLILTLNVVAPSTHDVRVFRFTVPIVSQVRGRVIEVPIEEGNVPIKKGDVLFRIDPTPYQLQVNTLQAQLANAVAQQKELEESLKGAEAKVVETKSAIAEAAGRVTEVTAKLDLARKRVAQYRELVATGAGSKFDLEQAEANVAELGGQRRPARPATVTSSICSCGREVLSPRFRWRRS